MLMDVKKRGGRGGGEGNVRCSCECVHCIHLIRNDPNDYSIEKEMYLLLLSTTTKNGQQQHRSHNYYYYYYDILAEYGLNKRNPY